MKMHIDEIMIDTTLVHNLIAEQFPEWAHLPLLYVVSSGTDHALYKLGDNMVIRLPRIACAAQQIDKEFKWLPQLAPHLSVAIPKPLVKGKPTKEYPYPWLISHWLEGKNGIEAFFDTMNAAKTMAQCIKEMRSVNTVNAPLASGYRSKPLYESDTEIRKAIAESADIIDAQAVTKAWKKALDAPMWDEIPTWTHTDLHAGNILIQEGKISAIIDFGLGGLADPACDIQVAWTLLDTESRLLFRSLMDIDDATWERSKGWALRFVNAIPYYRNTNPTLVNIAIHAINEVLQDN